MKILLNSNQMFWGLMDPKTLKPSMILTESHNSVEVDEAQLQQWELKQIRDSIKNKRISISVELEDLLKLINIEKEPSKEKKVSTPKKVAKKLKE